VGPQNFWGSKDARKSLDGFMVRKLTGTNFRQTARSSMRADRKGEIYSPNDILRGMPRPVNLVHGSCEEGRVLLATAFSSRSRSAWGVPVKMAWPIDLHPTLGSPSSLSLHFNFLPLVVAYHSGDRLHTCP